MARSKPTWWEITRQHGRMQPGPREYSTFGVAVTISAAA
jgi:hypothetical protein